MRLRALAGVWAPPLLMAGVIFALSSIPGQGFPRHAPWLSVAVHLAEFYLLGLLLARSLTLALSPVAAWVPVAITVGFCVIYGVADELHQLLVPARVFDPADIATDLAGAVLGAGTWWWRGRRAREGEGTSDGGHR